MCSAAPSVSRVARSWRRYPCQSGSGMTAAYCSYAASVTLRTISRSSRRASRMTTLLSVMSLPRSALAPEMGPHDGVVDEGDRHEVRRDQRQWQRQHSGHARGIRSARHPRQRDGNEEVHDAERHPTDENAPLPRATRRSQIVASERCRETDDTVEDARPYGEQAVQAPHGVDSEKGDAAYTNRLRHDKRSRVERERPRSDSGRYDKGEREGDQWHHDKRPDEARISGETTGRTESGGDAEPHDGYGPHHPGHAGGWGRNRVDICGTGVRTYRVAHASSVASHPPPRAL